MLNVILNTTLNGAVTGIAFAGGIGFLVLGHVAIGTGLLLVATSVGGYWWYDHLRRFGR